MGEREPLISQPSAASFPPQGGSSCRTPFKPSPLRGEGGPEGRMRGRGTGETPHQSAFGCQLPPTGGKLMLGPEHKKRPEPVFGSGRTKCPWFHLNSYLAGTRFIPGNGGGPAGHCLPTAYGRLPSTSAGALHRPAPLWCGKWGYSSRSLPYRGLFYHFFHPPSRRKGGKATTYA